MIRCGDIVTLEIIGTNMLGNGVAKVDDMVVFCRGAVEGDTVIANITDVKKNYAEAKCLKLVATSEHRQIDPCPYSEQCGGCTFGAVDCTHETDVKKNGITSALRREKIRYEVSEFVACEREGYRNKAVFHFDGDKNCGFFRSGTAEFFKIGRCIICAPEINEIKNEAERLLKEDDSISADGLTYLYIRYMKETNEASVVIGYTGSVSLDRIASALTEKFESVKCVMRGEGKTPESKDARFSLIAGKDSIHAEVAGIVFSVSPAAFFQVNTEGAAQLCCAVSRLAKLGDGEVAADLYCGTGLFGLYLAKETPDAEVYGIELNDESVRCANENAARNGITNAFFLQGDSSELISKASLDKVDIAIVDPPRTGLSKKTIAEIIKMSPKRIVYVSCNPSTLARDIRTLSDIYSLTDTVGVDMFPRTKHVESVALMSRA